MKKILLIFGFILVSANSFSQFGVKAGMNYNSNGEYKDEISNVIEDKGDSKIGYHFGAYYNIDLTSIYLRPELVYTKTKSDYLSNSYDLSKLDFPVLLGVDLIGPLSVFAGPSFQYILNNDLENNSISNVKDDITVGLNIGAAIKLGNIGFDVRYERGLSSNEASFINDNNINLGTLDSRPSQLIFSLSIKLYNKE